TQQAAPNGESRLIALPVETGRPLPFPGRQHAFQRGNCRRWLVEVEAPDVDFICRQSPHGRRRGPFRTHTAIVQQQRGTATCAAVPLLLATSVYLITAR